MKVTTKVVLAALIALQIGCSGMGKTELPALSAEAQERFSGVSKDGALESADNKLKAAYEQEMSYFAPRSLKSAEKALGKARKLAGDKKSKDTAVFSQILAMEAALVKAENTKVAVLRELADVFALQDDLDSIHSKAYDKRRYAGLMSDIDDLIEYIEEGNSDKARSKLPKLTQKMLQFEVDTIVYNALNLAKIALADARDVDADDLAVKSYEKAEALYESAETFIRENSKQTQAVQRRGANALLEAKHAIYVAKMVKALQGIKPDKFEAIVLDEERRLDRVTQALEIDPIHDRSVTDQAQALADAVVRLKDRAREIESTLNKLSAEQRSESESVRETQQTAPESAAVESVNTQALAMDVIPEAVLDSHDNATTAVTDDMAATTEQAGTEVNASVVEQAPVTNNDSSAENPDASVPGTDVVVGE